MRDPTWNSPGMGHGRGSLQPAELFVEKQNACENGMTGYMYMFML